MAGFTREFAIGAAQFIAGGTRNEGNDTHMNDAFGALMIGALLPLLTRLTAHTPG